MASLLRDAPWDRAVGSQIVRRLFGCQCISLRLSRCLSLDTLGHARGAGGGRGGQTPGAAAVSEAVTQQSLGCSAQEKVEAEAILGTVLSQGESEGGEDSTTGRERSQAR